MKAKFPLSFPTYGLIHSVQPLAGISETIRGLKKKLRQPAEARRQTTQRRNEEIKKAFDTKISRRKMYTFMYDNFPELMPSREEKDGTKDPFMSEEKMWESYNANKKNLPQGKRIKFNHLEGSNSVHFSRSHFSWVFDMRKMSILQESHQKLRSLA